MKNVLFVSASLGFGGAAKILTFVATELSKRGYNVGVVNVNSVSWKTECLRKLPENLKVYNVENFGKHKNTSNIKQIVRFAKDFKADMLIGFTSFPNMYAKIVGTILGIPSIMSERGDPSRLKNKTLKGKLSDWIINRSKGGVFQTDGARKYYGKGLQKRSVVIPNPIFVKGDVPSVEFNDREKSVVSVGRLDNYQKRYDVMLKAFKLFNEKHPDYKLKLYGEGPAEQDIIKWIKELDITDSVELMGLTKNSMVDMAKCGMFLITSDFEGISNSLLEAMAVGLPCVSTDHTPGGARMLIKHGENGLLAPVEDAEKLADCMCQFAENSELAKNCGEKAREVLTRFSPEKIIDQWENYIKKF